VVAEFTGARWLWRQAKYAAVPVGEPVTAQQVQFSRFDAVDYLDGDEAIEAYLQAVREEERSRPARRASGRRDACSCAAFRISLKAGWPTLDVALPFGANLPSPL